ncbi:hypothetical protein K438DRAFT_1813568 [Mycena galopus ATCC 62051]|nr:hypothetical protein K438DRAFT_1813568 [Mycena galopus ATCC 62051]
MTWLFWRKRNRRNDDASGRTLPQELVDNFMLYLEYDYSNLRAAALVCRSWSVAAQGLLFKTLHLNTTRRYRRVQKALRMSPHLVHWIHALLLYGYQHRNSRPIKIEAFQGFCDISFTHVESVVLLHHTTAMTLGTAIALQQLFSLPTLRRVELENSFHPATFLVMRDNCSPTIRHLQLRCWSSSSHPLHPILPRSSPPVALMSLKLDSLHVDEWLSPDVFPFDLSQLAVLSITTRVVFGWLRMAPALKTIEALEIIYDAYSDDGSFIDLSLFSNLQFLRIGCHNFPCHSVPVSLRTLSTITSSSPICQIVVYFPPRNHGHLHYHDISALFDTQMAVLPLPSLSLAFEMSDQEYTRVVPFFPRLQSKNMLCRIDYGGWFERHVDRLG